MWGQVCWLLISQRMCFFFLPTWTQIEEPTALVFLLCQGVGFSNLPSPWWRMAPGLYGGLRLCSSVDSKPPLHGHWDRKPWLTQVEADPRAALTSSTPLEFCFCFQFASFSYILVSWIMHLEVRYLYIFFIASWCFMVRFHTIAENRSVDHLFMDFLKAL